MPVNNMQTRSWYQAAGDDFLFRTSDFNMLPGNIFVTAGLTLVIDGQLRPLALSVHRPFKPARKTSATIGNGAPQFFGKA